MAAECSPGGRGGEPPTLLRIMMRHFPGVSDETVGRMATTMEKRAHGEARGRADADRDALACMPLPWHAASPPSVVAHETATVAAVVDPFADVVPEALVPAERAADELSAIRMDVALDPAMGAIGGEMSVTWRNPASQPLGDVWFRLFPNAFYYGEGGLQVADVTVDGAPVSP